MTIDRPRPPVPTRPTPRWRAARALLAATAVLVALAAAKAARAADGWVDGIEEGIARQERERTSQTPEAILQRARLAAARRTADQDAHVVRLYLLARAYGIAGDPGSARSTYREVLALAPRCWYAYHDVAMLQMQQTPPDLAGAESNLRQAIAIRPAWVTAHRKLATLLLQTDRAAQAVPELRRVVELEPGDLQARYLLATALLQSGRVDDAAREVAVLRQKDAQSAPFRDLEAQIHLERGELDAALALLRQLAVENPANARPIAAYLRCLDRKRERDGTVDVDAYLWALEGLARLERDPERSARIKEAIEEMSRQAAQGGAPAAPEGPPSDEQLAALLAGPNVEARRQVLRYVFGREEAPSADLLRATMRHLAPRAEPDPAVRAWALRVLGRYGGFGMVGLLRHAVADPDPGVRSAAVSALVGLGEAGPPARGAVFLVLGRFATLRDPAVAETARLGVLALAGADLGLPEGATEAEQRAAFDTWWDSPIPVEERIRGLERFDEIRDLFPEDVLLPYLEEADAYVADAAWKALARERERARDDARGRWLRALPPPRDGALRGGQAEATRAQLQAWAAQRPR